MSKPEAELQYGELGANVDRAWAALIESMDPAMPSVMIRGNELVRWTERGELEPYNITSLTDRLSQSTRFYKVDKEGEQEAIDPPRAIADALLERDSSEYPNGFRVDSVVETPVLGSTGAVVDTPGHHPDDRLFYIPAPGLEGVKAADVEDVSDVEEARNFLLETFLGDFGFADESSKANALALLLTPFVREYIGDSPTPLFLIVAPEVGTGKSLLAQAALLPSCGLVPLTSETKNEEEQRKRITASLLSGTRAMVLDNITGSVTSAVLAGAITSGIWTDRRLGQTEQLVLPIRNVWVATGNNLDLTDDNMRRAVPIVLDPGEVRPSDRPKAAYRHEDLLGWAKKERAALVKAALTLVKHWTEGEAHLDVMHEKFIRSERRQRAEMTLGSFEKWGETVGGILAAASVKDFLKNRTQISNFNNDREETSNFLEKWRAQDTGPLTISELMGLCSYGGNLHEELPEDLQGKHLDTRALGLWLRSHRGAKYSGGLIERNMKKRTWSVR